MELEKKERIIIRELYREGLAIRLEYWIST